MKLYLRGTDHRNTKAKINSVNDNFLFDHNPTNAFVKLHENNNMYFSLINLRIQTTTIFTKQIGTLAP